jgi:hypothetical protein
MHPGVKPIEKTEEKAEVKRFRVRMLRGYFPADPAHPKHAVSGDALKVQRGEEIDLPIDEARAAIRNGIAERADEMPI